ncbi:MAG: Fic family protein [Polyangiaceae bacterium]|nr:Fic family protein [Polyangiaceae bacterium]
MTWSSQVGSAKHDSAESEDPMIHHAFRERCRQIAAIPPELMAYEKWLANERAMTKPRDYLFTKAQPRFEPRKEDIVVPLPDLDVVKFQGECELRSHNQPGIRLVGITTHEAERILASLDGARCLLESRWAAGVPQTTFAKFLRLTFGIATFAPRAVGQLESAISGTEITRFPSNAYAIERPYWSNMADVRAHAVGSMLELTSSAEEFLLHLKELHVLALMGKSLGSFYKPASPISDEVAAPGVLYLDPPRILEGTTGTIFLDGPRVNVSLFGGEGYHRTLYASLDDSEAMAPQRSFSEQGISWGQYVQARSERDAQPGSWFCPPRPIDNEHIQALHQCFAAAHQASERSDTKAAIRHAAGFHQRFVRLHPFHCANQSIAMNLVNAVLKKAIGSGIPHLMLDHFALRLSRNAYERLFERATTNFASTETNPVERWKTLLKKNDQALRLITQLSHTQTPQQAETVTNENQEASKLALLAD